MQTSSWVTRLAGAIPPIAKLLRSLIFVFLANRLDGIFREPGEIRAMRTDWSCSAVAGTCDRFIDVYRWSVHASTINAMAMAVLLRPSYIIVQLVQCACVAAWPWLTVCCRAGALMLGWSCVIALTPACVSRRQVLQSGRLIPSHPRTAGTWRPELSYMVYRGSAGHVGPVKS